MQVLSGIAAQIDRNGIAVEQIDHFAMAVNNINQTRAFYTKVFNCRIKEVRKQPYLMMSYRDVFCKLVCLFCLFVYVLGF